MSGLVTVGYGDTTQRLINIQNGINQLLAGTGESGVTFTSKVLSPTYTLNAPNGWITSPTSLVNITDGDSNTSTNLFEVGGSNYRYGEILIAPGISIPTYNRINFRVGLQNSNGQRSFFELAAYNVASSIWQSIWGTIDNQSNTTDTIYNIDRILPFVWDKLRFQAWDIGQFSARARIYGLDVWEVS